jgi:hypothetical protein
MESGGTPAVEEWTERYEFSGKDVSWTTDGSVTLVVSPR